MIEALEHINEFGWFDTVLTIAIIIILIPNAIETWEKFKKKVGLKSVNEIEEENLENTISSLQEQIDKLNIKTDEYKNNRINDRNQSREVQKELIDSINEVKSSIKELRDDYIEDKIDSMRWKILDFANQLRNGRICYIEQFNNVLKTYDEYETLLKKHGLVNGQVEESIKFIREKYHEILLNQN